MTRTLHAWLEGIYAGRFTRDSTGLVQFRYHTVTSTPSISLSLPREGKPSRRAAGNFLENLLPDHLHIRKQMADAYGIETTDTFDLLEVAGGDVAGGLLLSTHEVQPTADPLILDPATDGDIAARIAAIKRTPDAWIDSRSPARFSLAGTQGKFALSQVGEEWYWSNATVPSTHILKPARPNLPGLEAAEAAALGLAAETGIGAPPAQVLRIKDQTTYVVERCDRDRSGQIAARIHTEDLAQAMGKGPDDKYGVAAAQTRSSRCESAALSVLRKSASSTGGSWHEPRRWMRSASTPSSQVWRGPSWKRSTRPRSVWSRLRLRGFGY